MRWTQAGAGLLLITSSCSASLVLHEKRDVPLPDHIRLQRRQIEKDALLPMRIGLIQNRHAELNAEKWIMDVSHPDSPNYGRHWTQEQVIEAFQPSVETVGNVTAWLHSHGIFEFTHSDNKMWFAFDALVGKAESMLETQYFEHTNQDGGSEASCDQYHLPRHLQEHIHYVTPGVKGSDITGRTISSRRFKRSTTNRYPSKTKRNITHSALPPYPGDSSLTHCDREVTPACIRQLYNFSIPDQSLAVSPNNSLGIFEADNLLYWQGDSNKFFSYFAPNIPQGTAPILNLIDGRRYPPNVTRGNDWKLITYAEPDLDLQCALPIIYPQTTTMNVVESPRFDGGPLSWDNYFNRFLDAIDGSYCSRAERGNSSQGGKPQCGTLKPQNVMSFSWGSPEHIFPVKWQQRQCNEYLKLGLQGVSLFICSQDWGVGELGQWSDHERQCTNRTGYTGARVFMPAFPASCPWVTAVGATQIHLGNTVYEPEVGAVWADFFVGSSGGGFALQFDTPGYQKAGLRYDAVSTFFKDHNPPWPYFYNGQWQNGTGRYNRNGRGIPDLSAVGTRMASFTGDNYESADGTSASTPIVAALFNRIVEERLRAGKGPLGFINPTLYQNPGALNDITKGSNGYCSKNEGFHAAPGWDPVTGLGTPDYGKLLDVFMKLP